MLIFSLFVAMKTIQLNVMNGRQFNCSSAISKCKLKRFPKNFSFWYESTQRIDYLYIEYCRRVFKSCRIADILQRTADNGREH